MNGTNAPGDTTLRFTQNFKTKDGAMLEQNVEIAGLDDEHAMIVLDKAFVERAMRSDATGQTMTRERFEYPPGSKYGDRESWRAGASRGAPTESLTSHPPAPPESAEDDETADATALSAEDIDISNLGDIRDAIGELTRDAQFSFSRKDGRIVIELVIAGRRYTFDDDDISKLRDLVARATSLEGEPMTGAEIVLPTSLGPVPLHVGAVATSGDDPATISHPKSAVNQTETTGLLAFTGLNVTAQFQADLTAAVVVNVDSGDGA
jgi:hypothetical protein